MKKKIIIEIEIPDGATHYSGYLDCFSDITFYKKKVIAGYDHWFYLNEFYVWKLASHMEPKFIKEIIFVE